MSDRTFVIAEVAGGHGGDFARAAKLVELAASIGADACKFQWTSSPARLAERRCAPSADVYRRLAFPREWFPDLVVMCETAGVEFMCTTYLPEDVHVLAPYVKRFKVASFEATNDVHFLRLHAQFQKPLILSAGMARVEEIRDAMKAYMRVTDYDIGSAYDVPWDKPISVLHCVSAYPAPVEQVNLAVFRSSWHQTNLFSGLSDHTLHPWTGALAVAAGARIVEFHARLADAPEDDPDCVVSRSPEQAREYVAHIRFAETVLGDGEKRAMPCEEPMLRYRVRR